ncbi:hypothetical protein AAVH_03223 [Aphelenchoides avenae]|nr:hypothetical protein AAVH_03223 [Aphelenchus avenae]
MKTEPKQEPEEHPVEQRPEATSAPTLIAVSEPVEDRKYRPPKAVGVLGPWVPVERKKTPPPENKPKIAFKDLPQPEAPPETTFTFDTVDMETSEVTFEEKKAPVATKKAKVVEFKKRKTTARNIRAREEEDD